MAKELIRKLKLQLPAGKATPAPPVGTALGPLGVNSGEFCVKYNDATRDRMGDIVPVEISVYDDRSFELRFLTPPTAFLIKKVAKVKKGSTKGSSEIVGSLTTEQLKEIAERLIKIKNNNHIEIAMWEDNPL